MVIVFVPLMIIWILDIADIMPVCQRPIVIDHTTEIILTGNIIPFQKVIVLDEVAKIQVVEWKLDHGLEFAPHSAYSLEAL